MKKMFYQRVCNVLAEEGISSLPRHLARVFARGAKEKHGEKPQVTECPHQTESAKEAALREAKASYAGIVEAFHAKVDQLGQGHLKRYHWYHTVDLGNGLVTPGDYDYRELLPTYHFPADMRGMRVLDVGSATGFFAFEFERRGAQVVSVDLPSMKDWDMVTVERDALMRKMPGMEELLNRTCVHGPFEFCHQMLHSKVERCKSRIYDLTVEKLGGRKFDLIFLGDVLGHLFSPLKALDVIASLCQGTLVVSLDILDPHQNSPRILYLGGDSTDTDGRRWFLPNRTCFQQMLDKVGFRQVSVVAEHRCIVRRCWDFTDRAIYHVTK